MKDGRTEKFRKTLLWKGSELQNISDEITEATVEFDIHGNGDHWKVHHHDNDGVVMS